MLKLSTRILRRKSGWSTALAGILLLGCDAGPQLADPGVVTMRRLSRGEYDRSVRDVLGIEDAPSKNFPPDDTGHGFDNLGDVLSLSPLHIQMYQRAAEAIAAEVTRPDGAPLSRELATSELSHSEYVVQRGAEIVFLTGTSAVAAITLPRDGTYRIRLQAYGEQAGPDPVQMGVAFDTRSDAVVTVPATVPTNHEVRIADLAGLHLLRISFLNDFYDPGKRLDRNLVLRALRVEGPLELERPNPLRRRLYVCTPPADDAAGQRDCASQILRRTGRLLYRRPLSSEELNGLLALFDQGQSEDENGSFDAGLRPPLEAMLLSPHFLFRVEIDDEPGSTKPHPLTAHELATRLSYFLWSSGPDDELLDLADRGDLLQEETLTAQIRRMLADSRAAALIDRFAAQWLLLQQIDRAEPDATQFPGFTPSLRRSLAAETRRFVADFFPAAAPRAIGQGLPLPELLSARFTYGNAEVAAHYGLKVAAGASEVRLPLDGTTRRGLLSHGSLLTAESYPTRTSPVRRGKWVLEQLLCTPPPPPPPNVIGDFGQPGSGGTLRQRLEAHRQKPVCASCHSLMDPIGLSLEGFDAIGRARTTDEGLPVDTTGQLLDGRRFADAAELAGLLAEDARLPRCAAEKLFTYAIGRPPGEPDHGRLDALVAAYEAGDKTVYALIEALARSEAFRNRRAAAASDDTTAHPASLNLRGMP
jgi:hypothetical protein